MPQGGGKLTLDYSIIQINIREYGAASCWNLILHPSCRCPAFGPRLPAACLALLWFVLNFLCASLNGHKMTKEATILRSLDSTVQVLTILPTEQCNFRCVYCYEDFKIGRMKPEIVSGIKKYLDQRIPNLKYLHISWFGGEPLLAKDIVMDIMRHANALADMHKCNLSSSMTTNAYLLSSDTLDELCAAKVLHYQITLDGPQAVHDKSRIRADGAGTFETIFRNIQHIQSSSHPVKILLRVHYSESNHESLPELLQVISAICTPDDRFKVHIKSIEKLGDPNAEHIGKWNACRRTELHEQLRKLLPESSMTTFTDDEYMCYASKPNYLVIRADGSLARCTVAFSDPQNNIGTINKEGEIDIDQDKAAYWMRGLFSGNQAELSCPAHN